MIVAERQVDIEADLVAGDVDIPAREESKYNMIPIGIMVVKDSAADEVVDVNFSLRGDDSSEVHYLKINQFYPFAVSKVYKTGTDAGEKIMIYGLVN